MLLERLEQLERLERLELLELQLEWLELLVLVLLALVDSESSSWALFPLLLFFLDTWKPLFGVRKNLDFSLS